jgi:hypothetical protein
MRVQIFVCPIHQPIHNPMICTSTQFAALYVKRIIKKEIFSIECILCFSSKKNEYSIQKGGLPLKGAFEFVTIFKYA